MFPVPLKETVLFAFIRSRIENKPVNIFSDKVPYDTEITDVKSNEN